MPHRLQRFERDNVYGNALSLLEQLPGLADEAHQGIHLDIACGSGPLAEPLVAALGVQYVGIDSSLEAVEELRSRGYEAHQIDIADRDALVAALREVIGERSVVSISLLDVLQAMPTTQSALTGIRDIAKEHDAMVVVSVPNVTHVDTAFKLAFGRWDVTRTGVLSESALQHFDRHRFEAGLRRSGLYRFAELNVEREQTDQHFPHEHPALRPATSLHHFLLSVRDEAVGDSLTSQFVWLCTPGPIRAGERRIEDVENEERPFLSIITRTQGARSECLSEVLTALAGQSETDFEVLVMGHKLSVERQIDVERVIEDCPQWLREKVRLLRVERGRRAAPLNEGFSQARGRYIAILDDDDLPFAHWVETFRTLADQASGRVLRTVSAIQNVQIVQVLGERGVRASDAIENRYPPTFDFIDHLRQNFTPNTALAFPRGVFHDLGIHFDETLTTTEDWDFIMRTTSVVGVASSPEITCIYRWWVSDSSSRTDHDAEEWIRNQQAILRKFDERPLLMPPGSAARVRSALGELDHLKWENEHLRAHTAHLEGLEHQQHGPQWDDLAAVHGHYARRLVLLREIQDILGSRSWRAAAPLRAATRLVGGRPVRVTDYYDRSVEELTHTIAQLRQSRSWRFTRPLRRGQG